MFIKFEINQEDNYHRYQDNSDLGQFGPSQFGPYFIRP